MKHQVPEGKQQEMESVGYEACLSFPLSKTMPAEKVSDLLRNFAVIMDEEVKKSIGTSAQSMAFKLMKQTNSESLGAKPKTVRFEPVNPNLSW